METITDDNKTVSIMKNTKESLEEDNDEEGEDEDLSWVKTFEDLLEIVGTRGHWNIMLFFLCTYSCFVSPMLVISYQFLGATPDHWCLVLPLLEANWTQQQVLTLAIPFNNDTGHYDSCHMYDYNYTIAAEIGYKAAMADLQGTTNHTITCHARDFNYTQYESTVTTEWDLVCERRAIYSTTQGALSGGALVGTLLTGFLFDRYGRRKVILRILVLYILLANLIVFSPNVEGYIAVRAFISFLDVSLFVGTFVVVMETVATKYRSAVGALTVVPWAMGYMLTPVIAYLVRPWRWLSICLALPVVLTVSYFWLLPESPRWLVQGGHHVHALTVLKRAAMMNGRRLPSDPLLLQAMTQVTCQKKREELQIEKKSLSARVRSVLSHMMAPMIHPELRLRSLVYILWIITGLVYYGISFLAINISVDPYLYIFLGGLLEIPSGLLIWPCTIYLGRRKTQVALFIVCGVSILLLMTLMLLVPDVSYSVILILSLTGKMAITAVYQLIWIYTTELFPTEYRSIALSQGQCMENIASMTSPYINDLVGETVKWVPSAVFGGCVIVAAAVALVLPETRGLDLPELSDLTKESDIHQTEKIMEDV